MRVNWSNSELDLIRRTGGKNVYKIRGKNLVAKRLVESIYTLEDLKTIKKEYEKAIPNSFPKTSIMIACNKGMKPYIWIIQEKIEGTVLPEYKGKDSDSVEKQYQKIIKNAPKDFLDIWPENFIVDKDGKLFYVDMA